MRRTGGRLSRHERDRGVVTAMVSVLAVFLILIISVVAEGGRKLSNLSQAEDIAAEAARSAAATLDVGQIANGLAVIDGNERARLEAEKVVAVVPAAEIVRFDVENDFVTVSVRVNGESFLPGFDIDGVGSHRAQAFDPFSE